MRRKLTLNAERLTELSTPDLSGVGAGAATTSIDVWKLLSPFVATTGPDTSCTCRA